jgi:hypothetical protein
MGLDDIIHYGHRYESMEHLHSGQVKVHFSNGKSTEGDLLVAADGVNSAIRKQLLPESCQPVNNGIYAVAGKIFVESPEIYEEMTFELVRRGICLIPSGFDGHGMFMTTQLYSTDAKMQITKIFSQDVDGVTHEAQLSPNAIGDDLLLLGGGAKKHLIDDARDYIFWGFITKHPNSISATLGQSGSMNRISQQDLLDAVAKEMEEGNWAYKLLQLVKKTDVNTVGCWPFHITPRIKDLSTHKPPGITFLGDSIHASTMP